MLAMFMHPYVDLLTCIILIRPAWVQTICHHQAQIHRAMFMLAPVHKPCRLKLQVVRLRLIATSYYQIGTISMGLSLFFRFKAYSCCPLDLLKQSCIKIKHFHYIAPNQFVNFYRKHLLCRSIAKPELNYQKIPFKQPHHGPAS